MDNTNLSLKDIKEGIRCIEAQLEYGYLDLGCAGLDDVEMAVVREAIADYKRKIEERERSFWEA